MSASADYQAAERDLSAIDPTALERLSPRRRQILLAMAALHRGERAGVLAAAATARAAGEADVAWLLELLAARAVNEPRPALRDVPGAGEVPELLIAVHRWRAGMRPRGAAELRRLRNTRPALAGLLDVLGSKRRAAWDGLARLSPRAPAVLAAASAVNHGAGPELATMVRQLVPDSPLDLSSYHDGPDPFALVRELEDWVDDAEVEWSDERTRDVARLPRRSREQAALVLRALLLAVHRRLAMGQGRGLLAPIAACRTLAHAVAPAMVGPLELLERRLGGLLEPALHLPPLLTLWRRSAGWSQRARTTIATAVMNAVARMLAGHDEPPAGVMFICEALAHLVVHAETPALRVEMLEAYGWLLPEPKFRELLALVEPAPREYLLGLRGFVAEDLVDTLATVTRLAQRGDADALACKLLGQALAWLVDYHAPHRELRQLERTLAALVAVPTFHLDGPLQLELLASTHDLEIGVESAHALVRRALARPIADGDPEVARHIVALLLLADEAGAAELVRRLGRTLRHAAPDAADELALGVLGRVHDRQDYIPDEEALRRVVAPLDSFVLRDGPERPLRAATRLRAASAPWAIGLGEWAREHRERLGPAPLWAQLIALADPRAAFDGPWDEHEIPW